MLDIKVIDEEIEKLENCKNVNWDVCNKLATLYTIKNYHKKDNWNNSSIDAVSATSKDKI